MSGSGDLVVSDRLTIPAAELRWRFSRSSGPGGQGVNTSDSRVELVFDVGASPTLPEWLRHRALQRLAGRAPGGVLVVTAAEQRSQLRNREAARTRLAELLATATAPPAVPRRPTRPSRGAVQRRLTGKKARGQTKKLRQRPLD